MIRFDLDDGKYTVCMNDDGCVSALRYGEPWRDCVGDNLIRALAARVIDLTAAEQQLDEVTKQRDALQEWKDSAMQVGSSWDAQAIGELIGVPLGCAILPQIEPAIRKMIAQRDTLVTACRVLLMSPEVQGSWPLDGSKRAQKPSDTYSKAEAKVKFRHLLKIHSIIEKGGES